MWLNYSKHARAFAIFVSVIVGAVLPKKGMGAGFVAGDTAKTVCYERSVEKSVSFWQSVKPRRVVVQYAGGTGLLSAGLGWMYGKKHSWETDFMLGYVPPYSGGRGKFTITARETYVPFDIKVCGGISCQPFAVAVYVGAITGREFWAGAPSRYPRKYYGFSPGVRVGLSMGQRARLKIPGSLRNSFRDVIFYYGFNTCDLDIVSFSTNRHISLWDIVNISLGVKCSVF